MTRPNNVILTGFMGTGKTAVGRIVARRMGWQFLDTDEEIERHEGMSIPELFQKHGEDYFRVLEQAWCRNLGSMREVVVATGGGMPVSPVNRKMLFAAGTPIHLTCSPAEIRARVGSAISRPLLDGKDVGRTIEELLQKRRPAYSAVPFHVDTTALSEDEAAERVIAIVKHSGDTVNYTAVTTSDRGGYPLLLGHGALHRIGDVLRDRGITSRLAVVTDTNVAPLYLHDVMSSLESVGFAPFACTIEAGEQSKSLAGLTDLYSAFVAGGLDRRGAVVALGGGVVGDLAGFAAATYMRGVALVQCPTTLLAMVDSSVGGKTGIDLVQGKNLAGSFKQPLAVVADTKTLHTLPPSETRMGMAELIKHAVIGDPDVFRLLERGVPLSPELVQRSVAVKIRVVETDPFESGLREVLNLGHTVGHALEKCSRYGMAHGDAVAVGIVAAARISARMGLCSEDVVERIERLLGAVGLPLRHRFSPKDLIEAMLADKKVVEGRMRFVLISDVGAVVHGRSVDPGLVEEILESIRER